MRKFVCVLLCILIMGFILPQRAYADDLLEDETYVEVATSKNTGKESQPPVVDAISSIVMDVRSGRVLHGKNASTKRAIASTTKIMTCLLAIEKGNLEDVVTVSKRAASIWGSTVHLKTGQQLKLRELLYGLMLNSGNDAAIAVAEHIGGSVEAFAEMMNSKAVELGAFNSNFRSPHGLDTAEHYSTAYDLAVITKDAMQNQNFSKIVRTRSASFLNRSISNTNELLGIYPGADGVKTGYTGQAGRCLVASAERGGFHIISVVLGSPTRNKRAQGSKALLDYAFNNYSPKILIKQGEEVRMLPVVKGIYKEVGAVALDEVYLPLRSDEEAVLETNIILPKTLKTPILKDQEIGRIEFSAKGQILAISRLKAEFPVRKKIFGDYFRDVLMAWSKLVHG